MKNLLLVLGIVMSTDVVADTFNLKYGLGALHGKQSAMASFGYQRQIHKSLAHQIEGGLWVDRFRSNSGFASYALGMHLERGFMYGETMHGVGFITHKDSLLGGKFQFFHDLGIGVLSKDGSTFGIQLKHVSSAGIHKPNIGRNFFAIKAGFAL